MFPALRQNGLARWLALVLALFGLAAGLLLCLALGLKGAHGRRLGSRADPLACAETGTGAPATTSSETVPGSPGGAPASRREPAGE